MVLIRRFEEAMIRHAGQAPGLNHSSIGQEAVAVGACSALALDDLVFTGHRPNGHLLAKGANPRFVMAELFGRATGCCGGFGGNMHVLDVAVGAMGANGIVGGNLPLSVGAALSAKTRRAVQIVACFFGEGTANAGVFHESMNLAAIWRLPLLMICENNHYAVTVPMEVSTAVAQISEMACAYRIPACVVDGNDVEAVETAVAEAAGRARRGEGPTLIECMTYRLRGHYEGEQQDVYRPEAEINAAWGTEPIARCRARLRELGCSDDVIEAAADRASRAIDDALDFSLSSPEPDPTSVLEGVYA